MTVLSIEAAIAARAVRLLAGRRIEDVVLAPREATRRLGWSLRAPVLILSGGLRLYPARDGRAENAGALVIDDGRPRLVQPLALEEFIPRLTGDDP